MSTLPPILMQDDFLVAFNKPSGLLSVPGIGPEKADCLVARAARTVDGARIVHRLDRDTSGVIVLARDADSHRELSRQFHDREVEKTYIALLAGHVVDSDGIIEAPLRKDMDNPPCHLVDHDLGKSACTRWQLIEKLDAPARSKIEFHPETGRTHQLRIHACVLGNPIVGDDLYAPPDVVAMGDRLMLHAESLVFTHPVSGERVELRAPTPF
jgi:tRNA pseudouridine32 synthase/23S rRNA pseudouridine746 synthase